MNTCNYKKSVTTLLLALSLVCNLLSGSAFAGEAAPVADPACAGTVPGSAVLWEYHPDTHQLIITGSGDCPAFASPEDQPWISFRNEIEEVWFMTMEDLSISDLAFWFTGCTSLHTAEVPYTTPAIGEKAFADCPNLRLVTLYHGAEPLTIADSAFAGETLQPLCIAYDLTSAGTAEVLATHDWSQENRAVYFRDVYGVSPLASGYCTKCKGTYPYTVEYVKYNDKEHNIRHWCSNCGLDQCGGGYFENHTMRNGKCTKCGYVSKETPACKHRNTTKKWNGCKWKEYCDDCGKLVDSGTTHEKRTYGPWEDYDQTNHRRSATCPRCGDVRWEKEPHAYVYGEWTADDALTHTKTGVCECGRTDSVTQEHTDSDHDGVCDVCGYTATVFSVTLPVRLDIVISEWGDTHTPTNAEIANHSTAAITISEIRLQTENGWVLLPFGVNIADEKVDAKGIGLKLNGTDSVGGGDFEQLAIRRADWNIAAAAALPLTYDARVTASSKPVQEQVLTLTFVADWAN